MRFLPVFLDLSSATVAVIGGGAAARAKLRLLRSAGAQVRWYAGDVDVAEEVLLLSAPPGRLEVALSDPLAADFSDFVAVVAAAGGALDEQIAARARASNVMINVVDRPDLSTFLVPAVSIAARWWSRSAPAGPRRCSRAACASVSRRCCRRASAISRL